MRNILGRTGLAVLILITSSARAEESDVTVDAFAANPVNEVGQPIEVYVCFRNHTTREWARSVPLPGEYDVFPSDMFEVSLDGRRLPLVKAAEVDVAFTPVTTLRPGESLTLLVPMDRIARVPPGATGTLEVKCNGYAGARPRGRNVVFDVRKPTGVARNANVSEMLSAADWERRLTGGAVDGPELLKLAIDSSRPPLIRDRAMHAYLSRDGVRPTDLELARAARDADAPLALSICRHAASLKSGAAPILLALLSLNGDLGVRRSAAGALSQMRLSVEDRIVIMDAREKEIDGKLREVMALAVAGDQSRK